MITKFANINFFQNFTYVEYFIFPLFILICFNKLSENYIYLKNLNVKKESIDPMDTKVGFQKVPNYTYIEFKLKRNFIFTSYH